MRRLGSNMKAQRKVIIYILVFAMVLSMASVAFAAESPIPGAGGTYMVLGDSVAGGVRDGIMHSGYERIKGSASDLAATELNMGVYPYAATGTRITDIRSFYERDYSGEYTNLRCLNWNLNVLGKNGLSLNDYSDIVEAKTKESDLISIQVGTTDILFSTVTYTLWHFEEMLGISGESVDYDATYDRDKVYMDETYYSSSSGTVKTEPVYEGVEIPSEIINDAENFTADNFDFDYWLESRDSTSSYTEPMTTEDYLNILVNLCEIAKEKSFLAEMIGFISNQLVGRVAQYEVDYRAVIDDIYALNPDVAIALISETSPFRGFNLYDDIPSEITALFDVAYEEMNQSLIRMANEKNCIYVDAHDMDNSFPYDWHTFATYFTAGGYSDVICKLHPNANDQAITAERLVTAYKAWKDGTYEEPESFGIGNEIYNVRNEIKGMFGVDLYNFDMADFSINFDSIFKNITDSWAKTFGSFDTFYFDQLPQIIDVDASMRIKGL